MISRLGDGLAELATAGDVRFQPIYRRMRAKGCVHDKPPSTAMAWPLT